MENNLGFLFRGLSFTASLSLVGFVIGAVCDNMTNNSFNTVMKTGAIVGGCIGASCLIPTFGLFAVKVANSSRANNIEVLDENTMLTPNKML